jgi:hypothetical protein
MATYFMRIRCYRLIFRSPLCGRHISCEPSIAHSHANSYGIWREARCPGFTRRQQDLPGRTERTRFPRQGGHYKWNTFQIDVAPDEQYGEWKNIRVQTSGARKIMSVWTLILKRSYPERGTKGLSEWIHAGRLPLFGRPRQS